MNTKLSELLPGEQGVILSFKNEDLYLKLMEMGCVPGELITIERIAPLGDPISVLVAGYNLSLRQEEAESIFVEKIQNLANQ
jgi:ferrous iron transport protein A